MPVTVVSICNSALSKLGADLISSFDESTKSARYLKAIFDQTRDDVLRSHPWNFAIKRATWQPNATTPVYEFDYTFDIPSDCLRLLDIEQESTDDGVNYKKEGSTIVSNYSELKVRYIFRNEDPNSWDPLFSEALAWKLARNIAFALTQASERERSCDAGYKQAITDARCMDGMEGTINGFEATMWTNIRR